MSRHQRPAIFSGLIAYGTQKIKEQYAEAWGTEMAQKVAIFGARSLGLAPPAPATTGTILA